MLLLISSDCVDSDLALVSIDRKPVSWLSCSPHAELEPWRGPVTMPLEAELLRELWLNP